MVSPRPSSCIAATRDLLLFYMSIKSLQPTEPLIPQRFTELPFFSWSLLILFLLANAFLKGWHIGFRDIWLDEAFSIFWAQTSVPELLSVMGRDSNPPLYNLFLKAWISIAGTDKIWVRLPSLLFNLGSAVVLFQLAKRFFNLETAIIASVFFLISQDHLTHAQNTRSYALSSFLCLLSFYAYLAWWERESMRMVVLMIFLSWALILCHYSNFLIFLGQAGVSFFYFKDKKRAFWLYWGSQAIALLLFLPWLIYFYKNGLAPGAENPFKPGQMGDLARVPGAIIGNKTVWVAFLVLAAAMLSYYFIKLQKQVDKPERPRVFVLLGWSIVSLSVAWGLSSVTSFFEAQYLLILSFGFWLLLGWLLSLIPGPRWIRGVLVLAFLITAAWDFTPKTQRNENWPRILRLLDNHQEPGLQVVLVPYYQVMTFSYHYDREIFSKARNEQELCAMLEEKGVVCTSANALDREIFLEKAQAVQASKVMLIQCGFEGFDPEGEFPRMAGEVYEEVEREEFMHTRVSVFEKR